jgi:cytochrome oxidase Cu insertion factor (SCO1/SenC/PrrC family)
VDPALFRWPVPEGVTKAAKAGEDKLLAAGTAAPELGAVDAGGKPVSLSDYKGKVVLLNFWFLG